jgi:RHS repeat-associated protein
LSNPYRYSGREFDTETGLYYYRARYYDAGSGRFIGEDGVGFRAGVNFYRYVNNNPTDARDPTGFWSPDAHDQLIWNALHPCGVSNPAIYQIQQGSRFADSFAFQDPSYAYMHAMSDGSTQQSATEAQAQSAKFVADQLAAANQVYNAGGTGQGMFLLGLALHPGMDATSPAHTDPNGNPIPWCGFNPFGCSNLSQHGDAPDSIENLKHLNSNPQAQKTVNILIRNAYQNLTGKSLCCSN